MNGANIPRVTDPGRSEYNYSTLPRNSELLAPPTGEAVHCKTNSYSSSQGSSPKRWNFLTGLFRKKHKRESSFSLRTAASSTALQDPAGDSGGATNAATRSHSMSGLADAVLRQQAQDRQQRQQASEMASAAVSLRQRAIGNGAAVRSASAVVGGGGGGGPATGTAARMVERKKRTAPTAPAQAYASSAPVAADARKSSPPTVDGDVATERPWYHSNAYDEIATTQSTVNAHSPSPSAISSQYKRKAPPPPLPIRGDSVQELESPSDVTITETSHNTARVEVVTDQRKEVIELHGNDRKSQILLGTLSDLDESANGGAIIITDAAEVSVEEPFEHTDANETINNNPDTHVTDNNVANEHEGNELSNSIYIEQAAVILDESTQPNDDVRKMGATEKRQKTLTHQPPIRCNSDDSIVPGAPKVQLKVDEETGCIIVVGEEANNNLPNLEEPPPRNHPVVPVKPAVLNKTWNKADAKIPSEAAVKDCGFRVRVTKVHMSEVNNTKPETLSETQNTSQHSINSVNHTTDITDNMSPKNPVFRQSIDKNIVSRSQDGVNGEFHFNNRPRQRVTAADSGVGKIIFDSTRDISNARFNEPHFPQEHDQPKTFIQPIQTPPTPPDSLNFTEPFPASHVPKIKSPRVGAYLATTSKSTDQGDSLNSNSHSSNATTPTEQLKQRIMTPRLLPKPKTFLQPRSNISLDGSDPSLTAQSEPPESIASCSATVNPPEPSVSSSVISSSLPFGELMVKRKPIRHLPPPKLDPREELMLAIKMAGGAVCLRSVSET